MCYPSWLLCSGWRCTGVGSRRIGARNDVGGREAVIVLSRRAAHAPSPPQEGKTPRSAPWAGETGPCSTVPCKAVERPVQNSTGEHRGGNNSRRVH